VSTAAKLRARPGTWWLNPVWVVPLTVLPGLAVTSLISDDTFRVWWRTPKYFDSGDALTTMVLLGAFVAGCLLSELRAPAATRQDTDGFQVSAAQAALITRAAVVCTCLTMTGYGAWLVLAVSRGLDWMVIEEVLRGSAYAAEGYLAPVAGVTTLAQFAPLAVVCLLLDRWISGHRHTAAILLLVAAVFVRALLNTERLSVIELGMPVLVLSAAVLRPGRKRSATWLWASLPLLAPAALLGVFGIFEYGRSWLSFYSRHTDLGYADFVLRRVTGYYAVSGNNAALVVDHVASSLALPYYSVQFLWKMPMVSNLWDVGEVLGFDPQIRGLELLWLYGNPEFNTMSGLPALIPDYGQAGAALWWLVCGVVIGLCYRLLRSGDVRGLVLYPVLFIGLTDLARIFYWGEGRAFPALAGAVVLCAALHRRGASG
jgi:hypothetical protein